MFFTTWFYENYDRGRKSTILFFTAWDYKYMTEAVNHIFVFNGLCFEIYLGEWSQAEAVNPKAEAEAVGRKSTRADINTGTPHLADTL